MDKYEIEESIIEAVENDITLNAEAWKLPYMTSDMKNNMRERIKKFGNGVMSISNILKENQSPTLKKKLKELQKLSKEIVAEVKSILR